MDRPTPDRELEDNKEQAEAGTQAQDVADDAQARSTDLAEESEHGGRTNPAQIIPDDTPDLVDKMTEMDRSGRIDMDAYAGEPQMDDEEEEMGPTEEDE
ncbi:hypothetical protein sphantq_01823 [Sphingobium sp. AntQ-1]|uniref:hypothetical protein n=1 Tax=Sphingobium sp. AntQ-1 TaxID=2930091 RepID=UPI00234EE09F|nr:hypothetical protein [Sphingobium sp. AntQ-1]WCP13395.1 hypothetical protein sphantq_01823 [Sphingobium sp. AntQ-1]